MPSSKTPSVGAGRSSDGVPRPVARVPAKTATEGCEMTETRRTTGEEARRVGDEIGVDWSRFDLEQFRHGMDVGYEHGSHDPQTDVTGDDPEGIVVPFPAYGFSSRRSRGGHEDGTDLLHQLTREPVVVAQPPDGARRSDLIRRHLLPPPLASGRASVPRLPAPVSLGVPA